MEPTYPVKAAAAGQEPRHARRISEDRNAADVSGAAGRTLQADQRFAKLHCPDDTRSGGARSLPNTIQHGDFICAAMAELLLLFSMRLGDMA
jgi:hypothetical protein